jgi:predicted nucleotidyltransferase
MKHLDTLRRALADHPHPLLFATVSGAHLYGFPSADSDYDLRGVHVLPIRELLGLWAPSETFESAEQREGLEIDFVTHDARKFFRLLLKRNGYVLEQLYSPLVVATSGAHEELKEIAKRCVTRFHANHYLGFFNNQWQLFEKETPRRVKALLYAYRVLLTGIHLMRTGEVEANLVRLNEEFRLPFLPELVARKIEGGEKAFLSKTDDEFHRRETEHLLHTLEETRDTSKLPEAPSAFDDLNDLLLRLRMSGVELRDSG